MNPTTDGRDGSHTSENERLKSVKPPTHHTPQLTMQKQVNFTPSSSLHGSPCSSPSRGLKRSNNDLTADASPTPSEVDEEESSRSAAATAAASAPASVDPWIRDMLIRIDNHVLDHRDEISDLNNEISILKDQADHDHENFTKLQAAYDLQSAAMNVMTSRMISLEKRLDRFEATQIDQKNRSMRDNIIIRTKGEDYKEVLNEDTAQKVKTFINKELRVAGKETQDIKIHRAHRMGKAVGDKNSMMIAKIPHESDKRKIFSNVKILKGTSHSVSVQCAPETEERKMLAWPSYKAARKDKKETRFDHTGRLLIEGVPQTKYDLVKLPPSSNLLEGKPARNPLCGQSTLQTVSGHQFIAYAASVTSLQEISDYRDFLHSSGVLMEADFIPHAFSFTDPVDGKLENFDSDGDHFSGLQILKYLREKKAKDICIFVAHTAGSNPVITKLKNAAIDKVTGEALLSLEKAMK